MAPSKKRKRMTTPDAPSIRSPHHDRYRSPPPVGRSLRSRTLPVAAHTIFTPINAATTPPIAAAAAATPTADAATTPTAAAPATPTAADADAATAPTAAAPATPTAAAAITPRGYASPSTAASPSAAPPQTTWHPCHDLPPSIKRFLVPLWLSPGALQYDKLYSAIKITFFFSPVSQIEKPIWLSVSVFCRLPPASTAKKTMVLGTNACLWLVSWLGPAPIATMVERALGAHSVPVSLF